MTTTINASKTTVHGLKKIFDDVVDGLASFNRILHETTLKEGPSMKKIIAMLTCLLMLAAPMTALAHGHSSGSKTTKVCSVRSCKKTGTHKHNGKTYRAHHSGDGHSYHKSSHH